MCFCNRWCAGEQARETVAGWQCRCDRQGHGEKETYKDKQKRTKKEAIRSVNSSTESEQSIEGKKS